MLDEILAAMSRFDCQRALQLLSDVVVEYKPAPRVPRSRLGAPGDRAADDRKVTSLKVRRVVRNTGPTSTRTHATTVHP